MKSVSGRIYEYPSSSDACRLLARPIAGHSDLHRRQRILCFPERRLQAPKLVARRPLCIVTVAEIRSSSMNYSVAKSHFHTFISCLSFDLLALTSLFDRSFSVCKIIPDSSCILTVVASYRHKS